MKTKTCPKCQKVNASNALVCAYCGSTFAVERTKTVQIGDAVAGQSRLEQIEQLSRDHKDALIFFMAHQQNPLVVNSPGRSVVIGRYEPSDDMPTVDLEEFGGAQLGVSRRHAVIERGDDGFKLLDTNSKNGTWLNGIHLEPLVPHFLRSGDEVRLGQMSIHVYFNRPVDAVKSFMLLNVHQATVSLARTRLTYRELADVLMPFLRAMGDMQTILNELLEQSTQDTGVDAIVADKQSSTITVTLDRGNDVIVALRDQIMPWKRANRTLVEAKGDDLNPKLQELVLELVDTIK
ncbi:MAG: FHA domain-containing protein, partial [Anaerolineae bacterium]|nr:FHA domain-containing protein [Anaerolineae bacterium]